MKMQVRRRWEMFSRVEKFIHVLGALLGLTAGIIYGSSSGSLIGMIIGPAAGMFFGFFALAAGLLVPMWRKYAQK